MRLRAAPPARRGLAAAIALAATACVSERTPPPLPQATIDCQSAPAMPAGQPFTISGTATYDHVPATYDPNTGIGGLAFASAEQRPIRHADVEIRQCTTVLATTTTDAAGRYEATFTPGAPGTVYVTVLARTASPPIRIQDNTDAGAVWAVGQPITSTSGVLDVRATHGWTGVTYGGTRIAAPFAILDSMYTAARRLIDLPRSVAFPPVVVNWSPANYPSSFYDPATGAIGTSHYERTAGEIFILGAAGADTDEFDAAVIVHEWGHYFDDNLSRSDSPGGPHGLGDVLDPRLSFGEGFASAFAAMLLQRTIYADTYWSGSALSAFGWDVETPPAPPRTDDPLPGPFSELSVIRAVWDLYDSGTNEAPHDAISVGLGPIYDTLVGPQRTTEALTTIASFVTGLKAQPGVSAAAVDAVLAHHSIGPVTTEWGDGDVDLAAMYQRVTLPSSSDTTLDGTFAWNEQPQNRYYVFTGSGAQATVTTSSTQDVDLEAYRSGELLAFAWSASGTETITFDTVPGEIYVVVLTGWGGAPWTGPGVGPYSATVGFQ